jgi:hypothetical protein
MAEAEVDTVRAKYLRLRHVMDERVARLWAATEADALGYGGIATVMKATPGMSKSRIRAGLRDLAGAGEGSPRACLLASRWFVAPAQVDRRSSRPTRRWYRICVACRPGHAWRSRITAALRAERLRVVGRRRFDVGDVYIQIQLSTTNRCFP